MRRGTKLFLFLTIAIIISLSLVLAVDLYVDNVYYDNDSFYVSYCNLENDSASNLSLILENVNLSSTVSGLSVNGAVCLNSTAINKSDINFSEGDILDTEIDSDDVVNETDEDNNDLTVLCTGGSCMTYVAPSCVESDGGMDYNVNGSVNYTDSFGTVTSDDFCFDSEVLTEYFCNGTSVESVNYSCPWGCSNAACEPREQVVDFGASKGFAMDYETSLFWQRDSAAGQTWNNARNYCEAANFGGFIDWRLPTIEELEEFYPASVGSTVTNFVGSLSWRGSTSKIEEAAYSGNAPITAVGMRAKPGDVDRLRVEARELQGCTLGETAYKHSGSGLEKWIEVPDGYVVTAVGAGCVDGCNVKNLGIRTRQLLAPCNLGSQVETINAGSKSPERFYRAPSGYIITGITARASPGNIKGLKIGYRQIGLLPEEKFMDIEVGDNYWTSNTSGGNALVLNWNSGGVSSNSSVSTSGSSSVICVRDGRITTDERVGVGSCQLCMKHESQGTTAATFFGRLFGFEQPYESNWECGGFNDEEILNEFDCPSEGVFRDAACAIDTDDTLKLKVGCGDTSLEDTCQLCRRHAANNDRNGTVWTCSGFNGLSLDTDFVDDVDSNYDFDLMADCTDTNISDNCQLCRRHASRANEWECVDFGNELLTDFSSSVTDGYAFDLKIRCDIEEVPSCIDDDDGASIYEKASCTNSEGDVNWDYCNGTTLTEFTCDAGFNCTSTEVGCPYGCLDGACIQREEKNDAYFVLNEKGDFTKTLKEIVGENQELSDVDFRNTRFRLTLDVRRLSAISSSTGYPSGDVSSQYEVDDYAQLNSITRHNLESFSDPDRVPETVFEANKYDIDTLENLSILDLRSETDNEIYLFVDESLDQYGSPGVIHSSRSEAEGVVTTGPTKADFVDDGIANTYGNAFSAYVDFFGNLTFKYETQNQNSRLVAVVGVLACECSPGEERCDGSDYLSCNDGCGWINNGEVVGECGVRLSCSGDYDEFSEGTTNGYENGTVVNRTDVCINSTYLEEYSCLANDDVTSVLVECDLGCSNGACVDCIDSDGEDYSILGDAQGRDLSGTLFANESDRCIGDTLVERICTNGFLDSTFFDCPNGCENGACKSVDCSVDTGNATFICGTMTYNGTGSFCGTYDVSINNVSECDLGCVAGVCDVSTCDDNDLGTYENVTKSSANDSLGNVVTDVCANDEFLDEAVCVDGVATTDQRLCSDGCSNGKCIGASNCTDSDGGLDYYEEGVVVSCVGIDCVTGENESCVSGLIWESYCGKNDEIVWQQVECPEGCNLSTNRTCLIPEDEPNATCAPVSIGGPEISPGTRLSINGTLSYCDPFTLTYLTVKTANQSCINDYECDSNVCVEGECYSIRTELEEQRDILEQQATWIQEIRCFLRDLFDIQDELECLNESIGG